MRHPFVRRLAAAIRREDLIPDGARVLVALSGGADSCALAAALAATGRFHVSALHVHHGLRGAEADRDENAAREVARVLGIPFESRRVDVRPGASLEAACREARERAYAESARRAGATVVATGHTRDDQAETVIYRAARGAGTRGLRGILARRDLGEGVALARPMLVFSRDEVRRYAAEWNLAAVEDSTNSDRRFARNAIRHDVLPALEKARPGAARRLASLARDAAELEAWVEREARAALGRLRVGDGWSMDGLAALPSPVRHAVVAAAGAGPLLSTHRASLDRLWGARPRRVAVLARGWTAEALGGVLRVRPPAGEPDTDQALGAPGGCVLERAGIRFTASVEEARPGFVEGFAKGKTAWEEALDADAAPAPYSVGPARRGERIRLLGAPGSRRIADVLSARGVARAERRNAPVVRDAAGRPVWLVGVRIADGARITAATRRIVLLRAGPIS